MLLFWAHLIKKLGDPTNLAADRFSEMIAQIDKIIKLNAQQTLRT